MAPFLSSGWFLILAQVVAVDLLLGGDNAMLIALACRDLPAAMRQKAMAVGVIGALVARLALASVATMLIDIPSLRLIGGLLLGAIAINLALPPKSEEDTTPFSASSQALGIGLVIGLVSGFFKWIAAVMMRTMDGLMAIPSILLAIAVVSLSGASLTTVLVAITIPEIPRVAWLLRSVVLSAREEPYVEAAISVGSSLPRIMWRHLMPNTIAPLIVRLTTNPGSGTDRSMLRSNRSRVLSPSGVSVYFASWERS